MFSLPILAFRRYARVFSDGEYVPVSGWFWNFLLVVLIAAWANTTM
jgi:hypothetical protein